MENRPEQLGSVPFWEITSQTVQAARDIKYGQADHQTDNCHSRHTHAAASQIIPDHAMRRGCVANASGPILISAKTSVPKDECSQFCSCPEPPGTPKRHN